MSEDSVHVHELKTTLGKTIRIPAHQIRRCYDVAESFPKYYGLVIISARFGRRAERHYWQDGLESVKIGIDDKTRGSQLREITWEDLLGLSFQVPCLAGNHSRNTSKNDSICADDPQRFRDDPGVLIV